MSTISTYLDRPVAFQRVFVNLGAGITGALMLSQAIYWARRTEEEGWFYKTITEWTEETGLSRTEQENARAKLQKLGVLEIDRRGIPAKLYFRVDFDALQEALEATPPENKIAGNLQTGLQQTRKQDATEHASKSPGKPQTNIGKTTKKTTAETTPENSSSGAPAPAAPMQVAAPNGTVYEIPGELRYPGPEAKSHKTWIAYAIAYQQRYGTWPLWNKTVAGKITQFIDRVGAELAPRVAVHYVRRVQEDFIVKQMHSVGMLVQSSEKWATQFQTGASMTSTRAKQADQLEANASVVDEAMAIIRAQRAAQQGGTDAE